MSTQAPAVRRLAIAAAVLIVVTLAVSPFVTWPVALLLGWNASALTLLGAVLPSILRADGPRTQRLATREDETRDTARLLVQIACAASLVAVGSTLHLAKQEPGGQRTLFITVGVLTVLLSWLVVNCVFTLRYADLFYRFSDQAVDFGYTAAGDQPDYRDFAYLAFTIGMTYQVSDTALRDRRLRRTVLVHAFVSYFFGVVIVATGVNVVAGLLG
jgi:uncharacterized membrane protein